MQKVILDSFSEYSSTETGAQVNLHVRIEGPGIMPEGLRHVQGRHKDARRAVINAVASIFGIHPNDVEIVRDALQPATYEIELTKKTEAYIKRGTATIQRNPECHPTESIFKGALAALQSAEQDPRPTPRRAR